MLTASQLSGKHECMGGYSEFDQPCMFQKVSSAYSGMLSDLCEGDNSDRMQVPVRLSEMARVLRGDLSVEAVHVAEEDAEDAEDGDLRYDLGAVEALLRETTSEEKLS